MVGKKQGVGPKALREEGLEKTDNDMEMTSWPQVNMINQKNYYTEYLKRDDQILPLRLLAEEKRNSMADQMRDRDRALAKGNDPDDMDVDDDAAMDEGEDSVEERAAAGSKVVIIHPGSQNLRIGLGSDALPKVVPMVIARRSDRNESEGGEPYPKRVKLGDGSTSSDPEKWFGSEFATQYKAMCSDLKERMKKGKRRVLPNSKELVVNYNSRTPPEIIKQHNDPQQIDWTELPADPSKAPEYICGKAALRIRDDSTPRYKLYWPLQRGWYNEADYNRKSDLYIDIANILEEAIKNQCGLSDRKQWSQYGCVFIIPDLYERNYVFQIMELIIKDFGFDKICFIQESLAATYGAGTSISCVVDVGDQKTSIACVEEGMVIENSRVNIKIGGADITEAFVKMMLFDHLNYADINLKRRYDAILAEELKSKFCTFNENEVTVQVFDFYVRAPGQDTRKYVFKTYDEVIVAPQGIFQPSIFDNSDKLAGRRKLIPASEDLYDGSPNDPVSAAQTELVNRISPASYANGIEKANGAFPAASGKATPVPASTPMKQQPNPFARLQQDHLDRDNSDLGSPAPDNDAGTPAAFDRDADNVPITGTTLATSIRDDVLPVIGLDHAVIASIEHGARGDEKKYRDFAGGIMLIGGGSMVPSMQGYLEERLQILRPGWAKEFMVASAPRDMDPQGLTWKGGSVFGKLRSTREVWIGRTEFDFLGPRALAYKCLWQF